MTRPRKVEHWCQVPHKVEIRGNMEMNLLSIVVSAYNEEAGIESFYKTTREYGEAGLEL